MWRQSFMRIAGLAAVLTALVALGSGAAWAQAPPGANPFLSIPTEPPDWEAWHAWSLSPARLATEKLSLAAVMVEEEQEPGDAFGFNDTPPLAELLTGFGTGTDDASALDLAGRLYVPEAELLEAFPEDDGAIPLANDVALRPGHRVRVQARIGDGPYGRDEANSGDYDVYRVDLAAGQTLVVVVDAAEGEGLDSKVAVYDSGGRILVWENGDRTSGDAYLVFRAEIAGAYFVFVRGDDSFWPADPYDSSSGPKAGSEGPYTVTLGIDAHDVDHFSFDLEAGDVVGFSVEGGAATLELLQPDGQVRVGARHNAGLLLPDSSPLPRAGRASVQYVISEAGRYAVRVRQGEGPYALRLRVFRPVLEAAAGLVQQLFLDFDGAEIDAQALFGEGHSPAVLSPLNSFLGPFGFDPTPGGADENALIDAVVQQVEEKLKHDVVAEGRNPNFYVEVLNSRDHPDVFGAPGVSRIIIGGTREELGLFVLATAQSVDVGNFDPQETGVVLLDALMNADPGSHESIRRISRAPDASLIELLGAALGDIAAHEAGHLFGNFHTRSGPLNLMDVGRTLGQFLGVGEDGLFGSADDVRVRFGEAPYNEVEGFWGVQDTRNAVAFALSGTPPPIAVERPSVPQGFTLDVPYPNPFSDEARVAVHLSRAEHFRLELFDVRGRRVRLLYDGPLGAAPRHTFRLRADGLAAGLYLLRATAGAAVATRTLVLAR